ncbi:hypothetical protein A1O3_09185 [Capronia epimyces CBS 606.96]|uniref:Yippee/Mis18/Cereblon domain-containing protein n=1 Tax=Capronia epimyces CBS 606.96 TaxID=1182542 RepID=W9XL27_9EURO|nr:uncharacterized protein A1O3_09185 [Capronia epimyces CBS 606.96]EXJ78025.1 hypothetical protein A1O3_09185 [Capronia epimyces CBS 606.96]
MPSEPAKANVNLNCARCNNPVGVFDNEWIRLTSSYVRPAQPGTHFGTEVARRTQVVPDGATQPALQGCTLSEVSCKKCSTPVGQFCKAAPTREQECLIDQYFYKLSRTYLTDSGTDDQVDPMFVFGGDVIHARPRVASRLSLPSATATSAPRLSQTPSRALDTPSHPQPQPPSEPQLPSSYQRSPLRNGVNFTPDDDSILLEMRLRSQEERLASQNARLQQQDTHIQLLTSLVNSCRESVEDMKATLRELQSSSVVSQTGLLARTEFAGKAKVTDIATRLGQSGSGEVGQLRAENAALKARLDSIASVMGVASGKVPQTVAFSGAQGVLGKRKRNDSVIRSVSPQLPVPDKQDVAWSTQIPTPQSGGPPGTDLFHDTSTASTNVSSDGDSRATSRQPMQRRKHGQERSRPSADRGSTVPRGRSQPRGNHSGSVEEDFAPARRLTGALHETCGDELERSGSALLNLFTRKTLTTATTVPETSAQLDEQPLPSSVAGNGISLQQRNRVRHAQDDLVAPMDVESSKPSGTHFSITNVEFSDDDQADESFRQNENVDVTPGVTRGETHSQGVQDSAQSDSHSVPSRQTRRKTALAQGMLQTGKSDSKKHDKASGEARAQIRDKNQLSQLQSPLNHISPATTAAPPRTMNENGRPEEMAKALSSESRQETTEIASSRKHEVEKASWTQKATTQTGDSEPLAAEMRLTRRQQLAEEIRRRDQLAKEAMEMDD